jgi:hypothetical protein
MRGMGGRDVKKRMVCEDRSEEYCKGRREEE